MIGQIFCSNPLHLSGEVNGNLSQWPVGHEVTWTVVQAPPGFTVSQCNEIYKVSYDLWKGISGFKHRYTPNANTANIVVGTRRIDGPGNVLAEHQLPPPNCPSTYQLRGWIDHSDRWTIDSNWQQMGLMPLHITHLHETGHGIGIGHSDVAAVMAARLAPFTALQPWDIAQARLRYPPATPSTPPPGPSGTWLRNLIGILNNLTPREIELIESMFSSLFK